MARYPWELRRLLAAADRVVAPSRSMLADFQAEFPEHAGKGVLIHNGIDPEPFLDGGGRQRDGRTIVCVAAHNEKKGLDVLLRAFAALDDDRLRLRLVGDGPLRPSLEALASSLRIADRVEFSGWKTQAEIARLMHECALFVLPSRAEPFGLVILEALSAGCAVAASRVGGIPEILTGEFGSLLVPPDDPAALTQAIRRGLTDADLREVFARRGPDHVQAHFTLSRAGAQYASLFRELSGAA